MEFRTTLFFKLSCKSVSMVWACWGNFQASMSYVEQQPEKWFIGWFFNWINMVPVRFLESQCFVQQLLSSDYSIDPCFYNKLQQQDIGLRKLCMHGNCQHFDWMVFLMKIFQLLAESGRKKQKCLSEFLWAKFDLWFVAREIRLAYSCAFVSTLHASVVDK